MDLGDGKRHHARISGGQTVSLPALTASTGDDRVDAFLRDTARMFERYYPGRLKACYVVGSYAYGAAAPSSDLDLTVVFRDAFLDGAERRQATQSFLDHAADWSDALDTDLQDEVTLRHTNGDSSVGPVLKYGSLLTYGEDIRAALLVLPVANWARRAMHSGYWCVARGDGQPPIVTYPLSYPDPTGEFYGYDAPDHAPDVIAPEHGRVRRSNRSDRPGTRSLVTGILWAATGLIAHRAQIYVLRKRDVPALYAQHIGGEWADLLEQLYRRCRDEWGYAIPSEPAHRAQLRALCARVLGFENHALAQYKESLPDTLLTGDDNDNDDKLYALRFLRLKPFRDDDVITALQKLSADENAEVRQGAEEILKVIEGQDKQSH